MAASWAVVPPAATAGESRGIQIPAFYDPPAQIPASPGSLIRSEPMPLSLNLPVVFPGKATRLMYSSIDSAGRPVAVTGAYIEPTVAWRGPGPRPVVAFGSGTIGSGDQCAPSLGLEHPINLGIGSDGNTLTLTYDLIQMSGLLNKGVAVALTDYVGLGATDRRHHYLNRVSTGHAMLDVARAVKKLPGVSIPAGTKFGAWGYSQGGGASGAAVELQPTYAPDVNLVASYVGAPPANARTTMAGAEGGLISAAMGLAMNGFLDSNPELVPVFDRNLNASGKKMLADTATMCIADVIASYPLAKSGAWTVDGKTLGQVVDSEPLLAKVIDDQRIGRLKPKGATLIATALGDNTVPHGMVKQLAKDWCGKGAAVRYLPVGLPALPGDRDQLVLHHLEGMLLAYPTALAWMTDRLSGAAAPSNCGSLGLMP
ncbi:lipase family protein [Aeromicrobium wangtongii]|uniref:Lipase family protein n=1 Tax=Aeromicrobium wangtongii TaxID=2969247 RepID=A0ABY5M4E4_9ACTN|nr:lipase family protein [Aeromicrobium wangtongii]MCD9198912.1 lipase family protein [Aeromicrobium wangtongii]UUP13050.1 lipase family protein [Aeromicrobium wangtongii]